MALLSHGMPCHVSSPYDFLGTIHASSYAHSSCCLLLPNKQTRCQTALIREATLMRKFNHPAVLPLYAAFLAGRELWLVTPYMVSSGT